METFKGCTYWYEIIMRVDKNNDKTLIAAKVRIPVRCDASGEYASRCTFLDPSCATVVTKDILNTYLFDTPSVSFRD